MTAGAAQVRSRRRVETQAPPLSVVIVNYHQWANTAALVRQLLSLIQHCAGHEERSPCGQAIPFRWATRGEYPVPLLGGDRSSLRTVGGDQDRHVQDGPVREKSGRVQHLNKRPVPPGLLTAQESAQHPDVVVDIGPAHGPLPQRVTAGEASADADYIVAQTYNIDGGNWMS